VKPSNTSQNPSTPPAIRTDLRLDGILPSGEVHVWYTDLSVQENRLEERSSLLDSTERERAARFLVSSAKNQFVLSRSFLRILLGKYLGIEPAELRFHVSANGKPELPGSGLYFNLSHTEGTTTIAVTQAGRVGVDVERIRENLKPLELAERFFSSKEVAWLKAQPAAEQFSAFFACWATKESYIKAWGEGLSMPLQEFSLIPRGGNTRLQLEVFRNPDAAAAWSVWQLDLGPGLCSAVAVEAQECAVRVGRWVPEGSYLQPEER